MKRQDRADRRLISVNNLVPMDTSLGSSENFCLPNNISYVLGDEKL